MKPTCDMNWLDIALRLHHKYMRSTAKHWVMLWWDGVRPQKKTYGQPLLIKIDGVVYKADQIRTIDFWCANDWVNQADMMNKNWKSFKVGWDENWQCGYVKNG